MFRLKRCKTLFATSLLLIMLVLCQSASATIKASHPNENRLSVRQVGDANITWSCTQSTGHLNIVIHDSEPEDWEAYMDSDWSGSDTGVQPTPTDLKLPLEILIIPPSNAIEGTSDAVKGSMTDAKAYDYLVNDPTRWWGEPEYCYAPVTAAYWVNDDEVNSLIPADVSLQENQNVLWAWRNNGGQVFSFERITVSITWADKSPIVLGGKKAAFKPLNAAVTCSSISTLPVSCSYDASTGYVNIQIDTQDQNTDWTSVITGGYSAASEQVGGLSVNFAFPEDCSYAVYPFSGSTPDNMIFGSISNSSDLPSNDYSFSLNIGRYDEELGMFFPEPIVSERCGIAVKNGDAPPYERALIRLTFTDNTPIPVSLNKVHNITPDNQFASFFDGNTLVYQLTGTPPHTVITRIQMPDGASSASYTTKDGAETSCAISGDNAEISFTSSSQDYVEETTYKLVFYKSDNTIHSISSLPIRYIHGNPKPFPHYQQNYTPFPDGELQAELVGGIPGTKLTYDPQTGVLHFGVESSVIAAAKSYDPTLAYARITVKPKKGFPYYSFGGRRSSIICGKDIPLPDLSDIRSFADGFYQRDFGLDLTDFFRAERFVLHNGETSWFITNANPEYVGPYAGMVECIRWYRNQDGQNPDEKVYYYIKTFDPLCTITRNKIFSSRNDVLNHSVNSPCMIIETASRASAASPEFTLQASLYPSGEGTQYYELDLLDSTGSVTTLNSDATLFFPYPDGYDAESFRALNPAIIHYNDDLEIQQVFDSNIEYAENGMFITVNSLSPFVVTWNESAGASLPETGDMSHLILWSVLFCASIIAFAAFVHLKTNRHAAGGITGKTL